MKTAGCCDGCGVFFLLRHSIARSVCPGPGARRRDHCDSSLEVPGGGSYIEVSAAVARVMRSENTWPEHLLHMITDDRTQSSECILRIDRVF